jgi:S-adenosylmethionine synthetase
MRDARAAATNGRPSITVQAAPEPRLSRRRVEMCEHKGVGHPDTLTDGACEAAAVALAGAYRAAFGEVLHFNVDKGLLVGGRSVPRFGGGRIVEPAKLIVCGRAANPAGKLDLEGIVIAAVREHLQRTVRDGTGNFRIVAEVREGSENLKQLYTRPGLARRANDTSFGVGYAPLSTLEREVLDVAAVLRSDEFRRSFPAAGDDFKLMGVRSGPAHGLTVALAMIDRHVRDVRHYFETKKGIHRYLADRFSRITDLAVNELDDPEADSESGVYLTVSGLSAEMGDDGQVGRGNRVNGLITPGRPMSLEAAAGKNPVAHVGKIYNVLAGEIAREVCARVAEVTEASVQLVSRIGHPVAKPWISVVEVTAAGRLTKPLREHVAAVVAERLAAVDELTEQLVRGRVSLY